jgi:hypothetical protein
MAVRAKVRCNAIGNGIVDFATEYEPTGQRDTENQRFTVGTPWGDIRFGIDNPAALAQFEVNKCYYVDFSEASA